MANNSPFQINKDYSYDELRQFVDISDITLNEYGEPIIGECFAVLKDDKNNTTSFIATSYVATKGLIFTCIYRDK